MKPLTLHDPRDGAPDANAPLHAYCGDLKARYAPRRTVLFVQIPQFILKAFNRDVALTRGYYAFPPTGLQCLYEALKTRDLDFHILDLNVELLRRVHADPAFDHNDWLSIFDEHVAALDPYIVGISCMFDAGIKPLIQILSRLRERDRAVVITGGVIATYEWQNLLTHDLCHFVVEGEGENKLNFLFDHLTTEDRGSVPTPGIHFKRGGEVQESTGRPDIVTVQGSLIESYKFVDVERYVDVGSLNPFSRMAGVSHTPYGAVLMNRGCRAECTFCAVRDFMGRAVRGRSVEEVIEEMAFLVEQRGVRHFEWLDDDLLYDRKEAQRLFQLMIDRRWGVTWSANNGLIASSVDDRTMQLMRDSGCVGFKIGIETGNAEMLRKVKKPGTLDNFRKFSKLLDIYPEVFVGGNFIVGFPDETFAQMMDSFRFYLEMNLDWAAFTICRIIRGASAFSDFDDYFEAQWSSQGELIKNFIPSRDSSDGHLSNRSDVVKGLQVFDLDPALVPDEDQVKEIWFTFNLVGNYINNKNLRPGGRVSKFLSWVEMAQTAYPTNPYMSLFLALACVIDGQLDRAAGHYDRAQVNCQGEYWEERFSAFGLAPLLRERPMDKARVFTLLEVLRDATCLYS